MTLQADRTTARASKEILAAEKAGILAEIKAVHEAVEGLAEKYARNKAIDIEMNQLNGVDSYLSEKLPPEEMEK